MSKITIVTREGDSRELDGELGYSIMEIIRDNGVDELAAICGGSCSCASCHIIVDDIWSDKLSPMSGAENELLDTSEHRTQASRLSCQIMFNDALDGFRATIARED